MHYKLFLYVAAALVLFGSGVVLGTGSAFLVKQGDPGTAVLFVLLMVPLALAGLWLWRKAKVAS